MSALWTGASQSSPRYSFSPTSRDSAAWFPSLEELQLTPKACSELDTPRVVQLALDALLLLKQPKSASGIWATTSH